MTYDGVDIGEALQPIQDRVETYQSNGYAVVSPGDALSAGAYAVTVNSGNLNASDTLSVGSSNDKVLFDGSVKSLSSATNVRINNVSAAGDGTEQYRYDVIYADSSGEVQKTEGSVTKLDSRESQNNLTRFERFKGAIPNPGTDPSVIIAAVVVNSNDTGVGTSQLRDYRVSATHKVSALEAAKTSRTNSSPILLGSVGRREDFSGSDADARLDSALSAASSGDTIILEASSYDDNRTLSTRGLRFVGIGAEANGTKINGDWTLDAEMSLDSCPIASGSLTVNSRRCAFYNTFNFGSATFTVSGDNFRFVNCRNGSVTFQSGASGGIVDACTGVSYTDNDGGNTQGEIA